MLTEFSNLVRDYEKSYFDHFPEMGMFWGKQDVAQDRFTDYSLDAVAVWHQQEDTFLSALGAIDETSLRNSPLHHTYQLLTETLRNNQASRVCKEELWDVNPTFGWHNKLAAVAEKQPVGTPELRKLALRRWQAFAQVTQDQINNLKMGVRLGYTAPKPAVLRVLMQLKMMLQGNVADSPFYDFARRDGDPLFKEQIAHLITAEINPALQAYADYLENDYLPQARTEIGVKSLPAGVQCYQAKIIQETTLNISPDEIHERGLQYMKKLTNEVGIIGKKNYGTDDMAEIFKLAKVESSNYFTTEDDILNYNLQALERVKAKASLWFDLMPTTPGIIRPYPAHRAKTGASGEYHPPNGDGKEPGVFYINTYQPQSRSRIDQEATLFHELIPGHHYQIALQYEDTTIPELNRYLWNSGYGEGWALYVERLADDMGLYKDDISRLGMLSNESLRASRLVVDTGIHVMGWSREQAITYLTQHTALDDNIIAGEVDRYIMMPGQATSYMLGKLEIERLRQVAKDTLGARFDIREFHNQVLKNGGVTLPMLRAQIETWLTEKGTNHE